MPDRNLTQRTLIEWCGAQDLADTTMLAHLWNHGHGAAFLPDGANRLIAAARMAFEGRDDKRRLLFLRASDFASYGWQIASVADFLAFVTSHTEDRIVHVLRFWSGVANIADTGVTVCSLWAVNHASACSLGILDLIDRLAKEFRESQIALVPADFTNGGAIQTVDGLIGAVGGPSKTRGNAPSRRSMPND